MGERYEERGEMSQHWGRCMKNGGRDESTMGKMSEKRGEMSEDERGEMSEQP